MIPDALTLQGWHVRHVMSGAGRSPTGLHPNLREADGVPIYDVEDQPNLLECGSDPAG